MKTGVITSGIRIDQLRIPFLYNRVLTFIILYSYTIKLTYALAYIM
jgi:hypothetical protein